MQVFRTLSLLMGLLDSWAHLGPSWPDLVQKGSPKWLQTFSKKCPKTAPKNGPNNHKKLSNFGPQNGPQNGPRRRSWDTGKSGREFLKSSWSQDASKMAQDSHFGAKFAPSWPKRSQDNPKIGQVGPRWAKIAPNLFKQSPKNVQHGSNMSQDLPKMAPTWPEMV